MKITFDVRLFRALFWAALLLVAGCGEGNRTDISGKLSRKDGTPLIGARVILRSRDTGKTDYGMTDASGEFQLQVPNEHLGRSTSDFDVMIVEDTGNPENPRLPTIAAKYQDAAKSGLKVTAQPGHSAQLEATLDPP